MLCDAAEYGAEIAFWIETVELGATDKGVDGRGPVASRVSSGEQVVTPAESDTTQSPFGAVVIDLQKAIVEEACERTPMGERITDRTCGLALFR
jgi:hypothetical protein